MDRDSNVKFIIILKEIPKHGRLKKLQIIVLEKVRKVLKSYIKIVVIILYLSVLSIANYTTCVYSFKFIKMINYLKNY